MLRFAQRLLGVALLLTLLLFDIPTDRANAAFPVSGAIISQADAAVAQAPMLPQISAGVVHTCAVSASGIVQCWGGNWYGPATSVPVDLGTVSQINAGYYHSCAISTTGMLRCWGNNDSGQIDVPANLGAVIQVSAGGNQTCAVTTTNILRCWGRNDYAQTNVPSNLFTPPVDGTNSSPIVSVGGLYTIPVGQSLTLHGDANDPDNEPLTYSWDLDGDGIYEYAGQMVSFSAVGRLANTQQVSLVVLIAVP